MATKKTLDLWEVSLESIQEHLDGVTKEINEKAYYFARTHLHAVKSIIVMLLATVHEEA